MVVARTADKLSQFKGTGKHPVVLHCLNEVAHADGEMDAHERQIRDQLLAALS